MIDRIVAVELCVMALASFAGAAPMRTHALKVPSKMEMLRPGEVKPQGWLRDWCVTARDGYVSRMDEIDQAFPRAWNHDFHPRGQYLDWPDKDKGAWCAEGGAYWFEGLVRLAWELDDVELKAYARKRLEPLLECMNPNAIAFVYWMDRNDPRQMDEVERANHGFIVGASGRTTRAFLAYYEATGDERALRALTWCMDDPRFYFFGNPLTLPAPACDTWRYCGDAKLAAALDNFFATKPYPDRWPAMRYGLPVDHDAVRMRVRNDKDPNANWSWRLQHGVLCYESMLSWVKGTQWTGEFKYLSNVRAWLDLHERACRQPHGVIVADEQFGWAGPNRGTETCTVAGDILLYSTLASVTGEGRFADHVERSFFNAGAACTSRDYMKHVYFQAPNRPTGIGSFHAGPAGTGGLYKTKHWPLCCTAALARILPGYVQWMWMKPSCGGLAATLYAPNAVETDLNGTAVRIETKTDYPFGETLEMSVATGKPTKFPLRLRIPEWCVNPSVAVNGEPVAAKGSLPVDGCGFAAIDREWKTGDMVLIRFPMAPRAETIRDYNDGGRPYVSLSYGPLLFAHALAEKDENTPMPGQRTDWRLDSSRVLDGARVIREAMPAKWDWPLAAPLRLQVKSADGAALELVPYGCAKLRVAMFPDDCGRTMREACGTSKALHKAGTEDWALRIAGRSMWFSTAESSPGKMLVLFSSPWEADVSRDGSGKVTLTYSYSHPDHPDWAWTCNLSFVPTDADEMECEFFETRANRPGGDIRAKGIAKRIPPLPPAPDLGKLAFGEPIDLLADGLDGWETMGDRKSLWTFKDGVLENGGRGGANIRTKRGDFTDFRLSYDVRADKGCNSGVYLRGIYEIQTIDSYGKEPDSHNMGAVYGRATPSVTADRPAGEWQHVDVTLCDRHATVVLNGVKIIDNAPLRGVTGGALSPDQFAPGPIMIQGSHNGGAYRKMVLTPIR